MASMSYISGEGARRIFGALGAHGRAYISGVGRYSLVKTYGRSYSSFCNLRYLNKRINIKTSLRKSNRNSIRDKNLFQRQI